MLIQAVKQENILPAALSRPSIPLSCPCPSVHAPASLFPLPWLPTTLHLCGALPPSNFLVSLHSSHLPPRPTPPPLSHSLFFLSHPPTLQLSCHFCPVHPLWENNSLWQEEGERFGDQGHVISEGGGSGGHWGTAGYLSQLRAKGSS